MYAIAFDLDTTSLQNTCTSDNWRNAYVDIRNVLQKHGFDWQQGSVYFGDQSVTPVTCFVAITQLTRQFSWFAPSVRDIRMLRIEEVNDLSPVIEEANQR